MRDFPDSKLKRVYTEPVKNPHILLDRFIYDNAP